ncbi:hypothetical protein J4401_03675 [Candidatus Woesearchaeota archaeon]|nr:hypothetical protein [Candidatus Woesearchaeota archaeon]
MSWIILLEIGIIAIAIGVWYLLKKQKYKKPTISFAVLFISVLLFEIVSEPMWKNNLLDGWAYIYRDVSWVITLGWVIIFFISFYLVDKKWPKLSEGKKFWLYLAALTIITTPIEVILLSAGIREYSSVLTQTMSGILIPLTSAPIEIILTIPLIGALVIPFYKVLMRLV